MIIDEVRGGEHKDADLQFSGVGRWKGIQASRAESATKLSWIGQSVLHSTVN